MKPSGGGSPQVGRSLPTDRFDPLKTGHAQCQNTPNHRSQPASSPSNGDRPRLRHTAATHLRQPRSDRNDLGTRRNSKRGVTERGAGKGSGNSKGCYPCSSRTENEGSRWIWPGRPPSLRFLGVRVFVRSLGRGQGSTRRRTASISLICWSTSRRRANGFCAALSALNRALVSGPTSAQAITRSSGVCVGP